MSELIIVYKTLSATRSPIMAIIGSGFAGISAAAYLLKAVCKVKVYENFVETGGHAQQLISDGYTFDMGPGCYWTLEVFENFFNYFGYYVSMSTSCNSLTLVLPFFCKQDVINTYQLLLLPFLIVNDLLTGKGLHSPIAWYNRRTSSA